MLILVFLVPDCSLTAFIGHDVWTLMLSSAFNSRYFVRKISDSGVSDVNALILSQCDRHA